MDELAKTAAGPLMKLSALQKFVLVALSEPRYAVLTRKEFRQLIKERYYGRDSASIAAVLSRALCRLEERDLIVRRKGRWKLTDSDALDNGISTAFLAWAAQRARYARCGLAGPPLDAFRAPEPKKATARALGEGLQQPSSAKQGIDLPDFD